MRGEREEGGRGGERREREEGGREGEGRGRVRRESGGRRERAEKKGI